MRIHSLSLLQTIGDVAGMEAGTHFCCMGRASPYIHGRELAERSIAAVLKTVVPVRGPGVRIPHSPNRSCMRIPASLCLSGNGVVVAYEAESATYLLILRTVSHGTEEFYQPS